MLIQSSGGGNKKHEEIEVRLESGYNDDRRVAIPLRSRPREMWTEITKDLVKKEAIEYMRYQYEETDDFFYVMEYLKYVSLCRVWRVWSVLTWLYNFRRMLCS